MLPKHYHLIRFTNHLMQMIMVLSVLSFTLFPPLLHLNINSLAPDATLLLGKNPYIVTLYCLTLAGTWIAVTLYVRCLIPILIPDHYVGIPSILRILNEVSLVLVTLAILALFFALQFAQTVREYQVALTIVWITLEVWAFSIAVQVIIGNFIAYRERTLPASIALAMLGGGLLELFILIVIVPNHNFPFYRLLLPLMLQGVIGVTLAAYWMIKLSTYEAATKTKIL